MPRPVVILTGLSGSGKTVALRALEDQGYTTVDNLPVPLLSQLALLPDEGQSNLGLAVSIDGRSGKGLLALPRAIDQLRSEGFTVQVLYLEASDDVLLARFRYTRRRHPYGYKTALLDAIKAERELLSPLRQVATQIIDTTFLEPVALKSLLLGLCGVEKTAGLSLLVTSFGFKYGNPTDADFTLDVRFLPNPYYEEGLRHLSGLDEPVRAFIYGQGKTEGFLTDSYTLFANLLPHYGASGKSFAHLAVGCTGGRHRSVFVASWLAQRLEKLDGLTVTVAHRDLEREDKR